MDYLNIGRVTVRLRYIAIVAGILCVPLITECSWHKIKELLTTTSSRYSFSTTIPDCDDPLSIQKSLKLSNANKLIDRTDQWRTQREDNKIVAQQSNIHLTATTRVPDSVDILTRIRRYQYTSPHDDFLS